MAVIGSIAGWAFFAVAFTALIAMLIACAVAAFGADG
jgi:hypothetical protein